MYQAEAVIRYHFGVTAKQLDQAADEEFLELAALAYFYEDRRALAVKRGLLMALAELGK